MADSIEKAVDGEAQARAMNALFNAGMVAGKAGLPLRDNPGNQYAQGWVMGDTERRVIAGEVIGYCCSGSRCAKCAEVNYGHRMGCACWPRADMTEEGWEKLAAEGYTMHWGALVLSVKEGKREMVFMSEEDLRAAIAAGTPIVSDHTGKPIEFEVE